MGTIKADTVTGLADPNKATIPNTITMGSTTATLNFGNTVIANASAGSTTITGEGGSTTTNLQQGLSKHWASFNGSGTVALFDSFNNASLTDNGTGDYTLGITNDFRAAAVYCMAGSVYDNGATSLGGVMSDTPSAGSLQLSTAVGDSFVDRTYTMVQNIGDLA